MTSWFLRKFRQWRVRAAKGGDAAVWYVEARRAVGGAVGREADAMGSAVMVRFEHLQRDGSPGQSRWIPHDPPLIERLLLTCAHVITDTLGGNARPFDEIIAWAPGRAFQRWPDEMTPRQTRRNVDDLCGQAVRVALGPMMGSGVAATPAAYDDWTLLRFDQAAPAYVVNGPAVESWADFDADSLDVSIIGYPAGASTWSNGEVVKPLRVAGFRVERKSDMQGHVVLVGPDEARAGMSGGGVFLADGALAGIHRASFDAGMQRHSVSAHDILAWLADRGYRLPPAAERRRAPSLQVAATATAVIVLLGLLGTALAILQPWTDEAKVCIQAKNGAPIPGPDGKPLLYLPLSGLQLALHGDWMSKPVPAPLTDEQGQTCFDPVQLKRNDGGKAYPFRIHSENAPSALARYAPLTVFPHGVDADGRRTGPDPDLSGFVDPRERLQLVVLSETMLKAIALSAGVQKQGAGPQDLNAAISSAAVRQVLKPEARDRGVEAWATILQQARPVLLASTWSTQTSGKYASVVEAVGAYFEDGQRKATGFVLDSRSVVVPAFAVSRTAKRRWMIFSAYLDSSDTRTRVELGKVHWGAIDDAGDDTARRVARIDARGALPPPPAFGSPPANTGAPYRKVAVIGYPAQDARTPTQFQAVFGAAYDTRSAMIGQAWRPDDVRKSAFLFDHDATTTGGTAGGPVVDLGTGAVMGIHLGGFFQQGVYKQNSAVAMPHVLDQIGLPQPGTFTPATAASPVNADPLQLGSHQPRISGYDSDFLGLHLPAPALPAADGSIQSGQWFHYLHYSVAMHPSHRMALVAAANVDRSLFMRVPRQPDFWVADPRLAAARQPEQAMFADREIDRGHLISRRALAWGPPETADLAARAAFYWPNATPQHMRLNRGAWYRLEEKVYERLQPESQRLSVFAGPVFDDADWNSQGWRIPRRFWMVAVYAAAASGGKPLVHPFLVEQYRGGFAPQADPDWLSATASAREVSIAEIEKLTGLRFPDAVRP